MTTEKDDNNVRRIGVEQHFHGQPVRPEPDQLEPVSTGELKDGDVERVVKGVIMALAYAITLVVLSGLLVHAAKWAF